MREYNSTYLSEKEPNMSYAAEELADSLKKKEEISEQEKTLSDD